MPLPRIQRAAIATHSPQFVKDSISQIQTKLDPSAPEFKENAAQMQKLTSALRTLHEKIVLGGPEKARIKHIERKKMLPREYVV